MSSPKVQSWISAQPLDGPKTAWEAWWEKSPGELTSDAAQELLSATLPQRGDWRGDKESPAFHWLLPRLCSSAPAGWLTQSPKGFRVGSVAHSTPLHALGSWFRTQGYARMAATATPEDWVQRRRLFEAVMAAVSEYDAPLLSVKASRDAAEAFQDVGSRLLGVAYRLEAWPQAQYLESLGQTPDGVESANQPSPMYLASVGAWERALALGWDPLEFIGEAPWDKKRRWRRWLGSRLPSHNETNDPLTAHVVAWAATHDPEGLKEWQIAGCDVAARSASSAEEVEAAAALMEPWLPDVLYGGSLREPLWFKILTSNPDRWAARLQPFFSDIAARIQPCSQEPLWNRLGASDSAKVWMAVPEPLRLETLALCLKHGTPPPGGFLFNLAPFCEASTYTRWLVEALPAEWLWGKAPVFTVDTMTVPEVVVHSVNPEKFPELLDAPILAATRRHPPPDDWVPVVALAAHQAGDGELLAMLAGRTWTDASMVTLREAAPKYAAAVSAVEAAVAAHRLAVSLDESAATRQRPRL